MALRTTCRLGVGEKQNPAIEDAPGVSTDLTAEPIPPVITEQPGFRRMNTTRRNRSFGVVLGWGAAREVEGADSGEARSSDDLSPVVNTANGLELRLDDAVDHQLGESVNR